MRSDRTCFFILKKPSSRIIPNPKVIVQTLYDWARRPGALRAASATSLLSVSQEKLSVSHALRYMDPGGILTVHSLWFYIAPKACTALRLQPGSPIGSLPPLAMFAKRELSQWLAACPEGSRI